MRDISFLKFGQEVLMLCAQGHERTLKRHLIMFCDISSSVCLALVCARADNRSKILSPKEREK